MNLLNFLSNFDFNNSWIIFNKFNNLFLNLLNEFKQIINNNKNSICINFGIIKKSTIFIYTDNFAIYSSPFWISLLIISFLLFFWKKISKLKLK